MPPVNGAVWRNCREDMDLTSDQAAKLLGISGGGLRQIELERKPASGRLASRAAKLYHVPKQDLLASEQPAEQPKPQPKPQPQPKVEPVAPPGRRNGKSDRRGPRVEAVA